MTFFVGQYNRSIERLQDDSCHFCISAPFAANMSVTIDFASEYPLAARAVEESFYGLTGAENVEMAITNCSIVEVSYFEMELQQTFCSQNIDSELYDLEEIHSISDQREHTKTLGLQWSTKSDSSISPRPERSSLSWVIWVWLLKE